MVERNPPAWNQRGLSVMRMRYLAIPAFAVVLLPYLALFVISLGSGWTFPSLVPDRMNFAPWQHFASDRDDMLAAAVNSIAMSVVVAVTGTLGGLLIGRFVHRSRSMFWRFLIFVPFVISPVVVAVCLYDLLVRLRLAGTVTGVVYAQTMFATAFAAVYFSEQWSPRVDRLEQLVENLGGSRWTVWRHAIVPTYVGLILVCLLQTALFSWLDYGLISVIGSGHVSTVCTKLFSYLREASVNQAAHASLVLLGPTLTAFVFMGAILSFRKHRSGQADVSPQVDLVRSSRVMTSKPMRAEHRRSPAGVKIIGLACGYGATDVVQDMTFELPPGETLVILGESGCGKTTLLKALAGLLPIRDGTILLDEIDISSMDTSDRGVVYLDQEPLLFEHLTVRENIAFAMRLRQRPANEIAMRVDEILIDIGLRELDQRREWQLSGGQKQRIAFARAILANPQLLLLDEPFSSLDAQTRGQMQELFRQLSGRYGLTSVFVTHDVKEALTIGTRFARMSGGILTLYPERQAFVNDHATGISAEITFWLRIAEQLQCRNLTGEETTCPCMH